MSTSDSNPTANEPWLWLYLVVSEELSKWYIGELEPPEPYRIVELVVARNPSQARYLAAKKDNWGPVDVRDMPKFRIERKVRVKGPARIVSDLLANSPYWVFSDELASIIEGEG